jgi:hypothetical protein
VLAALLLASGAVAALVALTCAAAMRARLRYGFAGVPHTSAQALAILAANLRVAALVFAMAAVVRLGHRAGGDARWFRRVCDALALTPAAVNAAVLGVSFGAYGPRMLAATLPHGPVELAAFARAGALYLRARAAPVEWCGALTSTVVVVGLLVIAALLETYR